MSPEPVDPISSSEVEMSGFFNSSVVSCDVLLEAVFGFVLVCFGLFWFGLVWFGLVWFGLVSFETAFLCIALAVLVLAL